MFRIRIPRRVTLRKVHSIDHSISIETAQEDNLQVRKGGLPPLKLLIPSILKVLGPRAGVNRPSSLATDRT